MVFGGENCRCLKCCPSSDDAPVPVRVVTEETVTQFTVRNGIFETFKDAMDCCNLLAQQKNLPRVIAGNTSKKIKRVKCSNCKTQYMSFWCERNNSIRLLDHKYLAAFLDAPKHPCIADNQETGNRNLI